MSLSRDGKNVFADEKDPNGLSKEAYYFIGGLMKHIKAISFITNPIVNSYKRLVPGYEAPVYIAWSANNRTPLIRIPRVSGESTRVELRSPDGQQIHIWHLPYVWLPEWKELKTRSCRRRV